LGQPVPEGAGQGRPQVHSPLLHGDCEVSAGGKGQKVFADLAGGDRLLDRRPRCRSRPPGRPRRGGGAAWRGRRTAASARAESEGEEQDDLDDGGGATTSSGRGEGVLPTGR